MRYFSKFPRISYTLTEYENGVPRQISRQIPNMTVSLKIDELTDLVQTLPFETYRIEDFERPDALAAKIYGSSEYAWIIFLANKMRDWYDWPLANLEFEAYINKKYESAPGALNGLERSKVELDGLRLPETKYYQIIDGEQYFINETSYALLPPAQRGFITVYDQEFNENDQKRTIRLPKTETLSSLIDQFDKLVAV